jgi:hypothetical protein
LSLSSCAGFESNQVYEITEDFVDSRTEDPSRVDVSARPLVAIGPTKSDVETLLAEGLGKAAAAGRWDVVAQLARELEARRLTAGVDRVATEKPSTRDRLPERSAE